MYTVVSDYAATGEGRTIMVLISNYPSYQALARFTEIFGSYYAIGAEIHEGLKLDFPGVELLIPEKVINGKYWDAGIFEFHSSFHLNMS
jgi:hypothetical protein